MTDEPTDDVGLLYELLTGRKNMADVDEINSRADPGVELKFDVPNGEGCVYVQCMPFAVQAYDSDDRETRKLLDAAWDELVELSGTDVPHRVNRSDLRSFAFRHRQR